MNYLSIGYLKQYETFKANHMYNCNYTFHDNSYSSSYWGGRWIKEDSKLIDKDEKILVTSGTLRDRITETFVGIYDTFEEAYKVAISLQHEKINIDVAFIETVLSNKNITYVPNLYLTSKWFTIDMCHYSYDLIPLDPKVVNADTFNYGFFNSMCQSPKLMIYRWVADKHVKDYIRKDLIDHLDYLEKNVLEMTCRDLLINNVVKPKDLFDALYKKDIPLNKQYDKLNVVGYVNMLVYSELDSNELFTNKKTRDILEECMVNTPYSFSKSCYFAENYKRISKKHKLDIYEMIKFGISYEDINGAKYKITNDALMHAIKVCIKMTNVNFDSSFDFLFYAIDKASKKDLNETVLELIAKIILNHFKRYHYYCFHTTVPLKNVDNIQLVADAIVKELSKTRKNKTSFIKNIQKIGDQSSTKHSELINACILKSIHASSDISIKKALVKIGVEMK